MMTFIYYYAPNLSKTLPKIIHAYAYINARDMYYVKWTYIFESVFHLHEWMIGKFISFTLTTH